MTDTEYKQLCAQVHTMYGKPLELPYWESCSLVDEVRSGETTKEKLFQNLNEAAGLHICAEILAGKYDAYVQRMKLRDVREGNQ